MIKLKYIETIFSFKMSFTSCVSGRDS